MKQCFSALSVSLFMCLIGFTSRAQSLFTLNPDYHFVTPTTPGMLMPFEEIQTISMFETSLNDTIYLKWQVVVPDDCPDEWKFLVADTYSSWTTDISSNIDPSMNLNFPMPLYPSVGNQNSYFVVGVRPFQVQGCCTIQVLFSLADEPDSILETITYDIAMLDSSCFVSSNKQVIEESQFSISPNPSTGRFQLISDFPIQSTCMFDLLGNEVHRQQQNEGNSLIVDDLANSTYFLKVEFQNGRFIWKKIVVQR